MLLVYFYYTLNTNWHSSTCYADSPEKVYPDIITKLVDTLNMEKTFFFHSLYRNGQIRPTNFGRSSIMKWR